MKDSSRRPLYVQWQITVDRPCLNGVQLSMEEAEGRGERGGGGGEERGLWLEWWNGARRQNKCLIN